jgi:hypothetical protein
MKAPRNTHGSQFVSPAAQTTIAIAILAGFFAVLVAAANPGIAAAFTLGGLGVIAGTRAVAFVRRAGGVCVPGTDVCLRLSAA